jgi:hypothetical protein
MDLQYLYPDDLVVAIKDGKLNVNQPTPYTLEIPERWEKQIVDTETSGLPKHLITIDPAANVEDYAKHQSFILLTETAIVYPSKSRRGASAGEDHEWMQTSFARYDDSPETANLVMNHEKYQEFFAVLQPIIEKIPTFMAIGTGFLVLIAPWLVGLFSWSGSLLYLFFGTALLWIICKIVGWNMGYQSLYRLGIYGIILPRLVQAVLSLIGFGLPPLGFTALFVVWMSVILRLNPSLMGLESKKKNPQKKARTTS